MEQCLPAGIPRARLVQHAAAPGNATGMERLSRHAQTCVCVSPSLSLVSNRVVSNRARAAQAEEPPPGAA